MDEPQIYVGLVLITEKGESMSISRREMLKRTGKIAGALAFAGAISSNLGQVANAHTEVDEELTIIMGDFFFQEEGKGQNEPIRVPVNKVVRLVFRNEGQVLHDAHFGVEPDLDGRKYNTNLSTPFEMLEIPAGSEAWLTFTFADEQIGEWEIGCFQPGHYEGGMKAPFIVE